MEDKITDKYLLERAKEAREKSYSPYSDYPVGVALETKSGEVYEGCNIENIAYTPTIHAEQLALLKAVMDGHRDFNRLALVSEENVPPCGLCRQTLSEFCDEDLRIILLNDKETTLGELLPESMDQI